jgi:hypothetical protein
VDLLVDNFSEDSTLNMEAVCSPERLVSTYKSIWDISGSHGGEYEDDVSKVSTASLIALMMETAHL